MKKIVSVQAACAYGIATCLLSTTMDSSAGGTADQPPMERPALMVRKPERAAMLSVAHAGSRIVAVGERGIAQWSEDAGRSWRQAPTPVSVTLTSVNFVDGQKGWAVGHGAVILHSTDGGLTWARQYSGKQLSAAANDQLAVGKTQDAAKASAVSPEMAAVQLLAEPVEDKPILDVSFADARIGYAVGAYGLLLRTKDGGSTWQLASHKLSNPKALHLNAVRTSGRTVLIAGEQGTAFLSVDAGTSFQPLQTSYRGSFLTAAILPSGGFALGGLRGSLLVSPSAQGPWSAVNLPTVAGISVLQATDGDTLRIGADSGQMFTYSKSDGAKESGRRASPMMAATLETKDGATVVAGLRGIERLAATIDAAKP